MDRRTFLATATGLGVAGLAGCIGGAASSGDYDVGMTISTFRPRSIEVPPGTTVVWRNTSKHTHTVTAYEEILPQGTEYFASGGFETQSAAERAWAENGGGGIQPGSTFEHEFTEPGNYAYFCIPHEPSNMVGTVVVSENATPQN